MPVEVRLPTVLRPHADGRTIVSARGVTIGEVLTDLTSSYHGMAGQLLTDDGSLQGFVNVYVNDEVRYLDRLDTRRWSA